MRILFFTTLFFTSLLKTSGQHLPQSLGNLKEIQTFSEGLVLTTSLGNVRILVYEPSVIRITLTKNSQFDELSYAVVAKPGKDLFKTTQSPDHILLSTDSLDLIIQRNPVRFVFKNKKGAILNEDEPAFGTNWIGEEVTTYKKINDGERFIGLGEKTGGLDRRGEGYTNWNTDNFAYAPNADPIYATIPFFMGIKGTLTYGLFLDNSFKSHFNFGASNNRFISFTAEDGDMNYYFIGRSTVAGIIESYSHLTGTMPLPPLWSLGYQQCRYSYYPDKEVLNLAKTFRDKKIPADVLYLDIHFMDAYKIFTWNKDRFPDPKGMIDQLKSMGFHLVVIVDPGIKVESGYTAYEDGLKKDVFLKYPDSTNFTGQVWPGWCHFPDFTNPKTREWWGNSFKGYVDQGIDGFWNDMNEPASWGNRFPDLVQFNLEGQLGTHRRGHNIYGMQMSRATYDGTRRLMGGRRPFVLTRASYAGGQRYSAIWTGDNQPTDDHMMTGVRLVNSLGLSGFPFAGMDVGGFSGDCSRDLYARWIQVGAFSPFFRGHTMVDTKDKEPWANGEKDEEISRNFISLRYRLMPYLYSTFYEATKTGMPVSRSLAIDYTFDSKIYDWNYNSQYLFGNGILVAPSVSSKALDKLYLPAGKWYEFYTGTQTEGGKEMLIETPIDRLTLYVREGSIIPMMSQVQNLSEKPQDTLFVHVYMGNRPNTFVYYEDAGDGYEYQNGTSQTRTMVFDPVKKTFQIQAPVGSYSSRFKHVKLLLHGFDQVTLKLGKGKLNTGSELISFLQPLSVFDPLGSAGYAPKNEVRTLVFPFDGNEVKVGW